MRSTLTVLSVMVLAGLTLGCEPKEAPKEDASAQAPATEEAVAASEEAAKQGAAKLEEAKKAAESQANKEQVMAKVGAAAPDFTLTDDSGKSHTLSDYKGKIVVLEWTSPACPYVVRHYDAKTMATTASESGEDVVWLSVDSSHFVKAEEATAWREKHGISFPTLLDADGATARTYAAKTTPHMFVVDKEGMLRYSGAIDDNPRGEKKDAVTNYVSTAVQALKDGKDVETPETKPYGCSVKYGS